MIGLKRPSLGLCLCVAAFGFLPVSCGKIRSALETNEQGSNGSDKTLDDTEQTAGSSTDDTTAQGSIHLTMPSGGLFDGADSVLLEVTSLCQDAGSRMPQFPEDYRNHRHHHGRPHHGSEGWDGPRPHEHRYDDESAQSMKLNDGDDDDDVSDEYVDDGVTTSCTAGFSQIFPAIADSVMAADGIVPGPAEVHVTVLKGKEPIEEGYASVDVSPGDATPVEVELYKIAPKAGGVVVKIVEAKDPEPLEKGGAVATDDKAKDTKAN